MAADRAGLYIVGGRCARYRSVAATTGAHARRPIGRTPAARAWLPAEAKEETMASDITPRRLQRGRRDRVVFGVCSGLGDYFSVDPVIVRLAFVLFTLAGGAGILAYIVLAIVLPEEAATPGADFTRPSIDAPRDADAPAGVPAAPADVRRNQNLAGLILIGLGLVFLANTLGWFGWFGWQYLWPLVLVGIGLAILLRRD
jgi:phage shock protein C